MYTERSNIAKELLDTEKKYFNSLNDLHSVKILKFIFLINFTH